MWLDLMTTPVTVAKSGIYNDRLVKVDGEWQYAERDLVLDPSAT